MAEARTNEALEKLNRGIQESKLIVQQQTMTLAKDFFGDSVEELKQQIKENRATLEGLPDQIPGGQEESFQMLFQELMDNYEAIEQALEEANNNVSEIDADRLMRQGELDATDAARREARERGVDLTEVEGTGTDGRITVDDVRTYAESKQQDVEDTAEQVTEEVVKASDAARRRAEEMSIDLSQVEGTGSGGLITVKDVTSAAGGAAQQAAGTARQAAGQATGQATDAVGQAVAQVDGTVDQATQQAGDVTGGNGDEGPKATNAAKRKAEDLGLDLSQIQGSGAGGIITIRDVVRS
jgi:pyruvate/2-oxoglutarate dehydrogenase complex dihydrolipoamide acyltransferase (E2) component